MAGFMDLLTQDPDAAYTYGIGAPPKPKKSFGSGLYSLNPGLGGRLSDEQDTWFNDASSGFENTFNYLAGLYAKAFGGSNFNTWLSRYGMDAAREAFRQNESAFNARGRGEAVPNFSSFFQTWNPLAAFNQMAPSARGEDPGAYSPFTRFLSR